MTDFQAGDAVLVALGGQMQEAVVVEIRSPKLIKVKLSFGKQGLDDDVDAMTVLVDAHLLRPVPVKGQP